MEKDNKQQLFEMLTKIDPSFKPKIGEEVHATIKEEESEDTEDDKQEED